MGIGTLRCHVIDVDDLSVAEAFWSELTGIPVIPSVFPGRYSYLGQADPWSHEVILHLVRTRKGVEANRSHVDIGVSDVDRAIAQVRGHRRFPQAHPEHLPASGVLCRRATRPRLGGRPGPVRQRVLPDPRARPGGARGRHRGRTTRRGESGDDAHWRAVAAAARATDTSH